MTRSRLALHLSLLGESAAQVDPEALAAEQAWVARMPLPPLELPPAVSDPAPTLIRRRKRVLAWGSVVLTAAVVALVLWTGGERRDPWGVRGAVQARIVVEKGGQTTLLPAGERLEPFQRFQIEVLSTHPADAVVGVIDENGRLLMPLTTVEARRVTLAAGVPHIFPGSMVLDKTEVGEAAVVLLCPPGSLPPASALGEALRAQVAGGDCRTRRIPLR